MATGTVTALSNITGSAKMAYPIKAGRISSDSIMHADGSLATGPIALCEVQAYVYAAKQGAAAMAARAGRDWIASVLAAAAEKLRVEFEADFWIEDLGIYALALDGDKRPCRVRSSNAGQVLVSGIAAPERAQAVAQIS